MGRGKNVDQSLFRGSGKRLNDVSVIKSSELTRIKQGEAPRQEKQKLQAARKSALHKSSMDRASTWSNTTSAKQDAKLSEWRRKKEEKEAELLELDRLYEAEQVKKEEMALQRAKELRFMAQGHVKDFQTHILQCEQQELQKQQEQARLEEKKLVEAQKKKEAAMIEKELEQLRIDEKKKEECELAKRAETRRIYEEQLEEKKRRLIQLNTEDKAEGLRLRKQYEDYQAELLRQEAEKHAAAQALKAKMFRENERLIQIRKDERKMEQAQNEKIEEWARKKIESDELQREAAEKRNQMKQQTRLQLIDKQQAIIAAMVNDENARLEKQRRIIENMEQKRAEEATQFQERSLAAIKADREEFYRKKAAEKRQAREEGQRLLAAELEKVRFAMEQEAKDKADRLAEAKRCENLLKEQVNEKIALKEQERLLAIKAAEDIQLRAKLEDEEFEQYMKNVLKEKEKKGTCNPSMTRAVQKRGIRGQKVTGPVTLQKDKARRIII